MTFFTDILKGIMIGIANIIPGVSGGTMAVSLGIYDKLIGSVSNLSNVSVSQADGRIIPAPSKLSRWSEWALAVAVR